MVLSCVGSSLKLIVCALCRQGAGIDLSFDYLFLKALFIYDMKDAYEPCQDLGRRLGSCKRKGRQ